MFENRFKHCIWQKESNRDNALYVDIEAKAPNDSPNDHELIYEIGQQQLRLLSETFVKSNTKALKYRTNGNKEFVKGNWLAAMRLYNRSLCLAEVGSENLCFAYANRSACFFHCKKYSRCLLDIDLAIKANYPQQLMPKLEARKWECCRRIARGEETSFEPKLDFKPNEKYPSLADILDIKRDDMFGRHIIAKEDINVGKKVLVEKSYVGRATFQVALRCNICLKRYTNLVACKQCNTSLFCVAKCEYHPLHAFECGLRSDADKKIDDAFMHVVRSILIAIHTIPIVEDLIKFVEQTIIGNTMNIPESEPNDALSKYRVFLGLSIPQSSETYEVFIARTYTIFKTLFKIPHVAAKFSSLKHQRFLKHLIAHHEAVIHYNCRHPWELGFNQRHTQLLPLLTSYFNHSCSPNVATFSCDGFHVAVVARPIKRGEQLFISYLGLDIWMLCVLKTRISRQKFLLENDDFECSCERCITSSPFTEANPYHQDANYYFVVENYQRNVFAPFDENRIINLLDKSTIFLQKYGHQEWSKEMNLLMLCFVHTLCLSHRFT